MLPLRCWWIFEWVIHYSRTWCIADCYNGTQRRICSVSYSGGLKYSHFFSVTVTNLFLLSWGSTDLTVGYVVTIEEFWSYFRQTHHMLPNPCKLFSEILTRRYTRNLDENQPPEQRSFRFGFCNPKHLQAINQEMERQKSLIWRFTWLSPNTKRLWLRRADVCSTSTKKLRRSRQIR
jgi:hypothetical protein